MIRLDIPEYAAKVIAALENNGYEAYAVGGCVRDAMLSKIPNDWDVTTSAKPHEVRRLFSFLYGFTAIPTGIEHGTVTVLSNGKPIEVTTYRVDGEYSDRRRPDSVEFCEDLLLDLARRDFTVNSMAYSHERGLIDPYKGADDLKNGIIRCVGDAESRFREDALRILRGVRFASVLGFSLEADTARAALSLRGLLTHVSRERIGAEISKLVCGKSAALVISEFLPIIEQVLPGVAEKGIEAVTESVRRLRGSPLPLMLAALLAETEPSKVGELLWSIRIDKKTAHLAKTAAEYRCAPLCDRSSIRRLCRDIGADSARNAIMLGIARGEQDKAVLAMLDKVLADGDCVKLSDLSVNGRDMIEIGTKPQRIGEVLALLLEEVISDRLPNKKTALLDAAKKINDFSEKRHERGSSL